jgi:epoxyqueuosine reductase QueG
MKEQSEEGKLKSIISKEAHKAGAAIIGFASSTRWEEYKETKPLCYPTNIYPFAKTIIVAGIPIPIPMLDTTPSIIYSELYNTANRLLDEMAYRLTVFIESMGIKAAFFPRDAYGDISQLVRQPEVAFSHVLAAKYAGLGTIGYNHTLLTPEYGPRVRFVSVFTEAQLTPNKVIQTNLCNNCGLCAKRCPTNAFYNIGKPIAYMNKHKCALYHQKLKANYCYPCGVCIKVCPVGQDRKLYKSKTIK